MGPPPHASQVLWLMRCLDFMKPFNPENFSSRASLYFVPKVSLLLACSSLAWLALKYAHPRTKHPFHSHKTAKVLWDEFCYSCCWKFLFIYHKAIHPLKLQLSDPWSIYQFLTPLRQGEIRLLLVRRPFESEQLECDIIKVELNDKRKPPEYVAISYTWTNTGIEPVRDHHVKWHWTEIPITSACSAAIVALLAEHGTSETCIWVDQLCIDQANAAEKSQQIGFMGEIYRSAHKVFVYLGSADRNQATAENDFFGLTYCIPFCRTFAELPLLAFSDCLPKVNEAPTLNWHRSSSPEGFDPIIFKGLNLIRLLSMAFMSGECLNTMKTIIQSREARPSARSLLNDQEAWIGLARVLNQRYFHRRWVIQENTTDTLTTCYISGYSMPLSAIYSCTDALNSILRGYSPAIAKMIDVEYVQQMLNQITNSYTNIRAMTLISTTYKRDHGKNVMPLQRLLGLTRYAECIDHRDVFYSLRSIASDKDQLPATDYGRSSYSVFLDHTSYLLETDFGPAILQRSGLFNGRQTIDEEGLVIDLPSWAPSWRRTKLSKVPLRYIVDLNIASTRHLAAAVFIGNEPKLETRLFETNSKWTVKSELNTRPAKLKLHGKIFGAISALSPDQFHPAANNALALVEKEDAMFDLQGSWLVTTANLAWTKTVSSIEKLPSFAHLLLKQQDRIFDHCFHRHRTDSEGKTLPVACWFALDYLIQLHYLSGNLPPSSVMCRGLDLEEYYEILIRRRLAAVENGFVGIVPDVAEVGDLVVVFDGCEIPMVVRKTTTLATQQSELQEDHTSSIPQYQVVGDAHFMQIANTLGWMLASPPKEQDFILV